MATANPTGDVPFFPARATSADPESDAYPGLLRLPSGEYVHPTPDYGEIDPPLLVYLHNAFQTFYTGRVLEYDSLDPLVPFLDGLEDPIASHRDVVDDLTHAFDSLEVRSEPLLRQLAQAVELTRTSRVRLLRLLRSLTRHHGPVMPESTAASAAVVRQEGEGDAMLIDSQAPFPIPGRSLPDDLFPSRPPTPIVPDAPPAYGDLPAREFDLPPRFRDAIIDYLQTEGINVNGDHVLALFLRTPAFPFPFDLQPINMLRNATPPLNHLLPSLSILESILEAQRRHLQLSHRRFIRLQGFLSQELAAAVAELNACTALQARFESFMTRAFSSICDMSTTV